MNHNRYNFAVTTKRLEDFPPPSQPRLKTPTFGGPEHEGINAPCQETTTVPEDESVPLLHGMPTDAAELVVPTQSITNRPIMAPSKLLVCIELCV